MLAWRTEADSVFVRDLMTGETRNVNGVGFAPLAVSPDHSQIIFRRRLRPAATSLATLEVTDLRRAGTEYHDVRWGVHGLEVLTASASGIAVMRDGSSEPVSVWSTPQAIFNAVDAATWRLMARASSRLSDESVSVAHACAGWS
jgi:hypothetical protein